MGVRDGQMKTKYILESARELLTHSEPVRTQGDDTPYTGRLTLSIDLGSATVTIINSDKFEWEGNLEELMEAALGERFDLRFCNNTH